MAAMVSSCDKFLDQMPDNRAEVDTIEKIEAMLTSAYLTTDYSTLAEYSSDNVNCLSDDNPYTDRFIDQVYAWQEITETNNSSDENLWQGCYSAVSAANAALEAIDDIYESQDADGKATLDACRGEALICRAYAHFILVNMFCLQYNDETSSVDPGIPYMKSAEHTLNPSYKRGTVSEDYENIRIDLEEGLGLVSDLYYTVPKFHFNEKAAWAFACRFYLYYGDYDLCIEYADKVLGSSPKSMLRDYKALGSMTLSFDAVTQAYVDDAANCNLLLCTTYGLLAFAQGEYIYWSKYSQTSNIMTNEMASADQPWGKGTYYSLVYRATADNINRSVFWRLPEFFEYTDAVSGIGYTHTVIPVLTTDEVLLNRAEAYILLGRYSKALEDMNLWRTNVYEEGTTNVLTRDNIKSFYDKIGYSNDENSSDPLVQTQKKHLNPAFEIDAEGSVQESMLQCVLTMRRIETAQLGMRWFDVKRYGIEIPRITLNSSGNPAKITDRLLKDDPRRALQIPSKVVASGFEANVR